MYEHKLIATALSSIYKWLYGLPSIFLNMLFFIFSIITFTVRGKKHISIFQKGKAPYGKMDRGHVQSICMGNTMDI